jgi:hypothetical protein
VQSTRGGTLTAFVPVGSPNGVEEGWAGVDWPSAHLECHPSSVYEGRSAVSHGNANGVGCYCSADDLF